MLWPIIEFSIHIILFLVLLIMMVTKLNLNKNQTKTNIYEKKLDLLHKKFLTQQLRKKNIQKTLNNSKGDDKLQHLSSLQSKRKGSTRGSIIGGIGNFKTNDEQLQNVDLQNFERLVKLNGDGFKQSQMQDFKLYLRIREKQLEEYQNIIINRRFQDIKAIQHDKWKLIWYFIKLHLKRNNVLLDMLYVNRLGQFQKQINIFVFILQTLIILIISQSIRRIFYFSWYDLNHDPNDEYIRDLIIGICFLAQFLFTSPLFLLIQTWIDSINSEYNKVKKLILRQTPPKHCLCVIMSDQGSINALITAVIFLLGVYSGICLNAELTYKIDFSIFITWIALCISELFLLRNFYIFTFTIMKFAFKKDQVIKGNIRITLFIYFLIDPTKKNGLRKRSASAERRIILSKLKTKKQKNDDLFEDADEQDEGGSNELNGKQKNKQLKSSNQNENSKNKKKISTNDKRNNQKNEKEEESFDDDDDYESDDLELEDEDLDEEQKEDDQQNQQIKQQEGNIKNIEDENMKKLEIECNNQILPSSILNNMIKNSSNSRIEQNSNCLNKFDSQNNNIYIQKSVEQNNQNEQLKKQLTEDITDKQQMKEEKRLNTSFAFDDESVIQDEQPVTLETFLEKKQPKNKKNQSYSRILSVTSEGYLTQQSQIYSPKFGYKQISIGIKTFTIGDKIGEEDQNKQVAIETECQKQDQQDNISMKKQLKNLQQSKKEPIQNKQDNSFTINREIALGKVNSFQTVQIMTLQEEKKYENDTSFLKNLNELKKIKKNENNENKTPNELSMFGTKDTSSFFNDEIIQNNNQKFHNMSISCILNKSELLEILQPNMHTPEQNA